MDQEEHHWIGKKPDPFLYFGFTYEITNLITGKKYIGKKQYHRWSKKKKVGKQAWEFYCGSSKDLHKDIKKYGKENFEFKILRQYKTRGGLVYAEANLQHKRDVLTKRLDGSDERMYYNKWISAIKFVPQEY